MAQTKIVYQEKELLQLIQEHLLSIGKTSSSNLCQCQSISFVWNGL